MSTKTKAEQQKRKKEVKKKQGQRIYSGFAKTQEDRKASDATQTPNANYSCRHVDNVCPNLEGCKRQVKACRLLHTIKQAFTLSFQFPCRSFRVSLKFVRLPDASNASSAEIFSRTLVNESESDGKRSTM